MSPACLISVLVAEDHAIVRQGICALLRMDGRFAIVGEARHGREAVQLARRLRPDVIVMDIVMPVLNGLESTRQILAARPDARVVILSAHRDDVYIDHAIQAGVVGFLEKQSSAEVLARAVADAAAGKTFFTPAIARRVAALRDPHGPAGSRGKRLTSREAEVLQLVAEGSANKQMADVLGISIKTVEKHRQHLMMKLHIHDTAGLTRYAISEGVIEGNVRVKSV